VKTRGKSQLTGSGEDLRLLGGDDGVSGDELAVEVEERRRRKEIKVSSSAAEGEEKESRLTS